MKKQKTAKPLFPVFVDQNETLRILEMLTQVYPEHQIRVNNDFDTYRFTDPFGKTQLVCASIINYGVIIHPEYVPLLTAHCQEWITDHIGMPKNGWHNSKDQTPIPIEFDLE